MWYCHLCSPPSCAYKAQYSNLYCAVNCFGGSQQALTQTVPGGEGDEWRTENPFVVVLFAP